MATSKLWVHVISATVQDADSPPVFVTLRVGQSKDRTEKLQSPEPHWEHNVFFELQEDVISGTLILELHKSKFLLLSELLGYTTIPLCSIRHSNKRGKGVWYDLLLSPSAGSEVLTKHQLQLDAHFELPHDLPDDLAEILDRKLRKLDSILEREVQTLELQEQKIVTGVLAPPTSLAYTPSYPFHEPSLSISSSSLKSDSPSQYSSPSTPSHDIAMQSLTPSVIRQVQPEAGAEEIYDDEIDIDMPEGPDEPLEFSDFDWVREDSVKSSSSGQRTPSRQIYTEVNIDVPQRTKRGMSQSPRHGYRRLQHADAVDNAASSQVQLSSQRTFEQKEHASHLRSQTLDQAQLGRYGHKRSSSHDPVLLDPRYSSLSKLDDKTNYVDRNSKGLSPLIHSHHHRSKSMTRVDTLSENENGASAVGSKLGLKRSHKIGTTDIDGTEAMGLRSRESSVVDLLDEVQKEPTRKTSVSLRWKKAYEKQLPEIRRRLTSKKKNFAGLSGNGAITLVQLVDQLKTYKMLSEGSGEATGSIKYFSTANTEFRSRSRSVIDVKRKKRQRKHFIDEDVRIHVYKRTVEALIYPASEPDNHKFETWSARKPTSCSECSSLLWGLHKQGVRCARCGKICHERCSSLASQDCFMHDQFAAITDKMHRMEVNHANRFQLLREAFNVPKSEHEDVIRNTKEKILNMAQNFSAEVTVDVITSQGLLLKESDHKIYVSVAIGEQKKRTKCFKRESTDKASPFWNEEFSFICYNYHEPIQIRVWNERDSAISRVAHRLTKEGDTFLGEKIIEVRRVGPPQDVWYKLGKRTARGSEVSGHIKLNISAKVEGERTLTPFHKQYMKLHEQLFLHCHLNSSEPLIPIPVKPPGDDDTFSVKFLPTVSQETIDEFALRYAIEPIFRMMVHVELLVNHHSLKGALTMIDNLLKNLKFRMFLHVAADHAVRAVGATVLMEEYMDASNFGRDNFSSLLDKLLTSLKLDLQQYREFYPPNDQHKLAELVETCQLLETVLEFQQQAMGIASCTKLEHLILENMKECVKSTFDFIIQNSIIEDNSSHPGLSTAGTPFQFFYSVIKQMKSVIHEDRNVYAPCISRFCSFNLGDVSAAELWRWFSNTIDGLFETPDNLEIFAPKEYINLYFSVKGFYETEVRRVPSYTDVIPEFPHWFIPCGKVWLLRYQKDGISFVDNAWEDDKNTFHFAPHEKQKFTSSSYQMFFYLHHGFEFVQSLGKDELYKEVQMIYLEVFAQVICALVQHYVDLVAMHIPEYVTELETACMLLNNLHSLRFNVQALYSQMGGENAGPGASQILQDFQSGVLAKQHSSWCVFVARSLTPSIMREVGNLQTELLKLKGHQGSVERRQVKIIVRPLLDMLTEKARTIAETCEQQIMQKVMKEVWYVCLESLHRMLLPMLKWEHEGMQALHIEFPSTHYSPKQCAALEVTMDILKDFFTAAGSQGVKMSTIERGMKQLKGVIGLYRETTEMLISDFILEETSDGAQSFDDASCGEVYVEVDAFSHPASGELEGHIRVMSATNLSIKGFTAQGALKPYIELHLLSPTVSTGSKRTFATHTKTGNSPNFNNNFKFTLANWENSELQVVAKHRSTFSKDKIIGIAVFPFVSIIKEASLTLGLCPSLALSDRGQAILNVLSVRTFDNFARDFVALKNFHQKSSSPEGLDQDSGL